MLLNVREDLHAGKHAGDAMAIDRITMAGRDVDAKTGTNLMTCRKAFR